MNLKEFKVRIISSLLNKDFEKEDILKIRFVEKDIEENFILFLSILTQEKPDFLSLNEIFSRIYTIFTEEKTLKFINDNYSDMMERLSFENELITFLINKGEVKSIVEYFENNPHKIKKLMNEDLLCDTLNFHSLYNGLNNSRFYFIECISFQKIKFNFDFFEKIKKIIESESLFPPQEKNNLILNFICNEYFNENVIYKIFKDSLFKLNTEDLLFSTLYFGKKKFFTDIISEEESWNIYKFAIIKNMLAHNIKKMNKCVNSQGIFIHPQVSDEDQEILTNSIFEKNFDFNKDEIEEIISSVDLFTHLDLFVLFYNKIEKENKNILDMNIEKYIYNYNIKIISFLIEKGFDIVKNKNHLAFALSPNDSTLEQVCSNWLNEKQISELIFKRIVNNVKTDINTWNKFIDLIDPLYSESGVNIIDKILLSLPVKVGLKEKRDLSSSIMSIIEKNNLEINKNIGDFLNINDLNNLILQPHVIIKDEVTFNIIKEKLLKYNNTESISVLEKKQIESALLHNKINDSENHNKKKRI